MEETLGAVIARKRQEKERQADVKSQRVMRIEKESRPALCNGNAQSVLPKPAAIEFRGQPADKTAQQYKDANQGRVTDELISEP